MCMRALTDPSYPKYPVLPVRVCRGVDPGPSSAPADKEPS